MKVLTLGTGAGRPSLQRYSSATALEYEGEIFLFDCGEGAQLQFMRSSLRWGKIAAIFIGHLHGDHVNGLPGMLSTLSMIERTAPLKLFGPPGLKKYLQILQDCKTLWLSYPLEIQEITQSGSLLRTGDYEITTLPLRHVITCWGFAFREHPRPGVFDAEKAKALGIPEGPLRRELVLGRPITLEDGRTIHPEQLLGPARRGRSFAYCLDTAPCENACRLAEGVDILVHEATFDEQYAGDAQTWGHSTAAQAARIAREARVDRLVLTHFSQRYPQVKPLWQEAQAVFKEVRVANDLDEFEIELG